MKGREAQPVEEDDDRESGLLLKIEEAIIEELLEVVDRKFLGPVGRIFSYRDSTGAAPAQLFLKGLASGPAASYAASFTRHCIGEFLRGEKHHIWQGGLYAYKHIGSKTRIVHTTEAGNIHVLLFGFGGKKENKVDQAHVRRAERMAAEYLGRRNTIEQRVRRQLRPRGGKRG